MTDDSAWSQLPGGMIFPHALEPMGYGQAQAVDSWLCLLLEIADIYSMIVTSDALQPTTNNVDAVFEHHNHQEDIRYRIMGNIVHINTGKTLL